MEANTNTLELEIHVKPGTVTQNFEQFKEMVKVELETKYKSLDVSEDSLQEARSARARLNKAKESLKESMRSAQRQNDEPLVVPKAQAKELEALLDEAIYTLDEQIKAIEENRRNEKMRKAMEICDSVFADASDDVKELASRCKWVVRSEWKNMTYSPTKVKEDCESARKEIESALNILFGEFAPQMFEDFIQYGSISNAVLEGQRLAKIKEANSKYGVPKTSEAHELSEAPECPSSHYVAVFSVRTPESFMESDKDNQYGSVNFRFSGKLYQLKWLKHLCKTEGINLEYINKEN